MSEPSKKPEGPATVLLGVTGCIAAYKACELVRSLQRAGLRVKVVMTEHATAFIGPVTFRALTDDEVGVDLFDNPQDPIHHISLAREADLFLIAPCTANVMAKLAYGIADDLLTTTALATKAPIVIAPAMNEAMYEAAATQENMKILKSRGVRFIDPQEGYLACGDTGKGRMEEPDVIATKVVKVINKNRDLIGKHVLITAGPTQETIDPVRYITNRSSGKMGYALANAALNRGAQVTLITGPVDLQDINGVNTIHVESADEMYEAVNQNFDDCDIAVFSAAVADVRPAKQFSSKLKKGVSDDDLRHIELVENPDILKLMGEKKDHQVVVGFAAETENVEENARKKLIEKHADMIVGNQVGDGITFGSDYNEAILVTRNTSEQLRKLHKNDLAQAVFDACLQIMAIKAL
ncbi:MAG: bifunctional phosphopantothenoylcysteine decarboxylase/phosphopantothenate--cysteine ligase CoaBC [Eggerthellaceae bacterium]|jgi:phosphopantothenoylcysteine decarboxylase/phosphopantothenate--cysteine ligase